MWLRFATGSIALTSYDLFRMVFTGFMADFYPAGEDLVGTVDPSKQIFPCGGGLATKEAQASYDLDTS